MDASPRMMTALLGVSVLAIGAWVVDRVSSEPSTAEQLEAAATDFAAATTAQDWAGAYSYMTVECQATKTQAEFQAAVASGMQMAQTMGLDLTRVVITDVQVRNVTATVGEVRTIGEVDGARLTDEEVWDAWVLQEGTWRSTDCPDISEPAPAGDPALSPPVAADPDPAVVTEPSVG